MSIFLIAEIGLSHEGSVGIAKSYIDLATDLGFDAIKFQTHNADDESSKQEAFRSKIFFQDKTRFDYWKRTSFDNDTWLFLKKYCDKKKIVFITSAFSEKSLKVLKKIGQKYWKIPSGEVTNLILAEEKMDEAIINLRLVDNKKMQKLNMKFRNKDKTTNVLSFTNDDISLKQTNNIGDIAISVEYVLNESEDIGKNFDEHMIHMLAHGIYHILGHDHQVSYKIRSRC